MKVWSFGRLAQCHGNRLSSLAIGCGGSIGLALVRDVADERVLAVVVEYEGAFSLAVLGYVGDHDGDLSNCSLVARETYGPCSVFSYGQG